MRLSSQCLENEIIKFFFFSILFDEFQIAFILSGSTIHFLMPFSHQEAKKHKQDEERKKNRGRSAGIFHFQRRHRFQFSVEFFAKWIHSRHINYMRQDMNFADFNPTSLKGERKSATRSR